MNHVYRLVWSHRLNAWVAVAENARGRKKGGGRRLAAAALCLTTVVAQAGPTGGQVISGSGQISSSGNTTTVTQSSQNLSLNWRSFNIAPQETVDFVQPSASAVAVNHIFDTNGTQILGHLNANGQVYLINPDGVLFGQGAVVNVGGLVASTLNPTNATANGATRSFSGSGTGSVINEGTIEGGYVVLMGNRVSNTGTIVAQMGTVGLGAGSAVTLTFASDKLVNVQVDASTLNNLAANGGLIQADGGRVIMTAGARNTLLASAVNNTGAVEARTVEDHDGTITLLAGMSAGQVDLSGTLDASAPNGGNGGAIETSGAQVSVASNARVTTQAPRGLTGSWLVDPQDFTVAASGGDITGSALSSELGTTNVTLASSSGAASGSGNVNVNDAVAWSANTQLTLTASNNVNVNANITATGATAGLVINPNTANGGESASGTGTFALNNGAVVTLSGANPSLSISGQAYTVINSLGAAGSTTGTDLQGINGNLSGYYALGSDIDATATASWNGGLGFTPIGPSPGFTGTFDGLGHSISNLTINRPGSGLIGLFGTVGATGVVQNVGLIGGSVTGGLSTGALVGMNYGTVNNSYATSPVSGDYAVGGLVGRNYGSITNSHATGAVTNSSYSTGGLVGENGTYWVSSNASISNSYATGAVTGHATDVGGLVGSSYGSITNAYATGSVTSSGANPYYVGGLVGALAGTVSNSYATGLVTGAQTGGLVGGAFAYGQYPATVTNSYWNVTTTGQTSSFGGGTGLTTAQMQSAASFTGFNFTTTPGAGGNNWVMVDADGTLNNAGGATGGTYPMLASEYSTTITNSHQLQLMAMALEASYTLGADIDATATAGSNDVWVGSSGFVPIATNNSTSFTGTFNGLGHTINGLFINGSNGAGLFTASSGTIENVGLVGGSVTGGYRVGQLVGMNNGILSNSYSTGTVNAGFYGGGLAGTNSGTISNSYSTATVNAPYTSGGLVGANYGAISNSYAAGTLNAGGWRDGGLVGGNFNVATITDSHSSTTLNTSNASNVGGLAGANYGTVSNSYSNSAVSGTSAVGGLVGANRYGTIANSYATGAVSGSTNVGGLVGMSYGFTGPGSRTITNSYATGSVTGTQNVGGLVGQNGSYGAGSSTISNSYATGAVSGTQNVGGLVGLNSSNYGGTATITNSYATGAVIGSAASSNIGGLVGYNYANAAGGYGGALATTTTIANTYATGAVSVGSGSSGVGGLIGTIDVVPLNGITPVASVTNSYWDTSRTGQSASAAGTGLTTAQMQQQSSFSGWDFAGTWIIYNGSTDPLLRSFMTPLTVTAADASQTYNGTAAVVGNGVTYSTTPNGNLLLGTVSYSTSSQGTLDVGAYSITPQGLYSNQQGYIIDFVSGTLTVNPATLTVTGAGAANKVYDGNATASLSGTLLGVIGSDEVTLTQTGTFASRNVGTGIAVTASDSLGGAAAGNYTLVQPVGLTANITPATLIYNAASDTASAGKALSGLTGTVSGFVSGDTLANATTGTLIWTTSATPSSPAGSYAIDGSGLSAANYVFTQASANATALTLTAAATSPAAIAGLESNVLPPTVASATPVIGASQPNTSPAAAPEGRTPLEISIDLGSNGKLVIESLGINLPSDAASTY